MTTRQISLVENSWDFILSNNEEAGMIFYERLFEIDPTLKVLFKNDLRAQAKKLTAMITFVVHKLNNLESVVAEVKALGQRHKNYNVKPEHYATVGMALIWTLERALGNKWDDETKQAWVTAYTILSDTMMQ